MLRVVGQPVLKEQREGNKRQGWVEGWKERDGRESEDKSLLHND